MAPKNFHILSLPEISAPGGLREICSPILNFSIESIDKEATTQHNRVTLNFMLHRGSYATVLLREIMKPRNIIKAGVPIAEYTPNQVKQAITGSGKADKKQMQEMIRRLLNLTGIPSPDDVADALSVALCHFHILR
jgi:Holliday junction resolvasome RuvABC endonuclease subunit